MKTGRLVLTAFAAVLTVSACTPGEPDTEAICLEAVGELATSVETYQELLETGVGQMRDADAVEKLDALSEQYGELLDRLDARAETIPEEVHRAHDLLSSGVGMQASAWMSISDGLRLRDPDLIDDGAELIALSRTLVAESELAIPDCSPTGG